MATGFFARLRGLLFTRPSGRTMLLVPCRSVHTFGMSYDLDIAFINAQGEVVAAYRDVRPARRLGARGAVAVLERCSAAAGPWPQAGEMLMLSAVQGQAVGARGAHRRLEAEASRGMPRRASPGAPIRGRRKRPMSRTIGKEE